jgi:molecular chaperone DnaJ
LAATATLEEIKKSFRRLAHEYHPDKNTTNPFAEARFREIHEAYTVLSSEGKRSAYDQEKWLSGRFKRNAVALTPQYFLDEVQKLNHHLTLVDVYRMNKELLHDYLLFLLSDDKAALLIQNGSPETLHSITLEILQAIQRLPAYFALPVLSRLMPIANPLASTANMVQQRIAIIKKEETLRKIYPWLIILVTFSILLAMYFFSKK